MKGMEDIMAQAQQLQDRLQAAQKELERTEVEGEAGAGLVKVKMNGRYGVRGVEIDPAVIEEGREILEDLVAAAVNDAVRRVESLNREKMSVLGGLTLPDGFKLPF